MMDSKPILYSYWRSSCAYRVRIALNLKGIQYEYKTVDLGAKSEQLSDKYKLLNPMQQVPALVFTKDQKLHTMIQSVAILELLEELFPTRPLLPKDPIQRAYVRSLVETIASGIQPLQNLESLRLTSGNGRTPNEDFVRLVIGKKFFALEELLVRHSGQYCFGDELSLADVLLVPQVYNANRYRVDMSPFPTIRRLTESLLQIPDFAQALPERQPDCPTDLRLP